jgi:hypothetical protein
MAGRGEQHHADESMAEFWATPPETNLWMLWRFALCFTMTTINIILLIECILAAALMLFLAREAWKTHRAIRAFEKELK